eukprot:gene13596-biopygen9104
MASNVPNALCEQRLLVAALRVDDGLTEAGVADELRPRMHLRVGEDGDPPQRRDALNDGRQRTDPSDNHIALLCLASEVAAQCLGGARGAGEGEAPDGTHCLRPDVGDLVRAAHGGLPVPEARAGGAEAGEDVVRGDEVDDPVLLRGAARAVPDFLRQPPRHRLRGRRCRRAEEPMVVAH